MVNWAFHFSLRGRRAHQMQERSKRLKQECSLYLSTILPIDSSGFWHRPYPSINKLKKKALEGEGSLKNKAFVTSSRYITLKYYSVSHLLFCCFSLLWQIIAKLLHGMVSTPHRPKPLCHHCLYSTFKKRLQSTNLACESLSQCWI